MKLNMLKPKETSRLIRVDLDILRRMACRDDLKRIMGYMFSVFSTEELVKYRKEKKYIKLNFIYCWMSCIC
jgi:hypothetical protein